MNLEELYRLFPYIRNDERRKEFYERNKNTIRTDPSNSKYEIYSSYLLLLPSYRSFGADDC